MTDRPSTSPPRTSPEGRRATRPHGAVVFWALAAAGLSIGSVIMGKAVRDALYLATFPVELLPYFVLGTGLLSGVAVGGYTRLNTAFFPRRVVPALALLTAATLPALWFGTKRFGPSAIAVLYAWTTITSTFLTSGFWAVLGERFDPRAARQLFGWVGVATTSGGLIAGFGTHLVLRVAEPESLLLVLAVLHVAMALAIARLGAPEPGAKDDDSRSSRSPSTAHSERGGLAGGLREIARTSYLRDMALLVAAITVAGTLADYVLKDAAASALRGKRELAEFFSLFHGAVGALTLGVQVLICRPLVSRKGVGAALVALPLWLAFAALAMIASPLLWAATMLRGGENAVRNSFHRSGYELLYVPLAQRTKRLTKPILDTLVDRASDALGAGLVLFLVGAMHFPAPRLSWVIVGLGALGLYFVVRVRKGYVETLSESLAARALELDDLTRVADDDATAREAIRTTLLDVRRDELRKTLGQSQVGLSLMKSLHIDMLPNPLERQRGRAAASRGQAPASRPTPPVVDPVVDLCVELASADAAEVRAAIARWDRKDRRAVPFLVRLLAREDVHAEVIQALARAGDRVSGTLADHLDDPNEAFAIRRRLPRALAACRSTIAIEALVRGLSDQRFEVRYQCAAALDRIQAGGGQRPAAEPVWRAIRDEVKKSRAMWEAQRLLDEPDEADADPLLAGVVLQRGAHSLRHVFRLLGLVLEQKSLELSYRAVQQAADPQFRAVGLEYLENVLPPDVRAALWPLVGDDEPPPLSTSGRSINEVMKELAASGGSIPRPLALTTAKAGPVEGLPRRRDKPEAE